MTPETPGLSPTTFGTRKIYVGAHGRRGMFVFDPADQNGVAPGKVRLFIVKDGRTVEVFEDRFTVINDSTYFALTQRDIWLAHRCYVASTNPAVSRPPEMEFAEVGPYGMEYTETLDHRYPKQATVYDDDLQEQAFLDSERKLLSEEIIESQDNFAASNEDGWFYDAAPE